VLFETHRHRQRRRRLATGFPPEWRQLLAARFGHWRHLDRAERARLEKLTLDLVADKRWEAARGFELTDAVIVLVAAQAAYIALGLPDDSFRGVQAIVIHRTTLVLKGRRPQAGGLESDDPLPILGQAAFGGPVLIAWDTVVHESLHPGHGSNVVFHEFAHKLDMLDGTVDGTPPLASRPEHDRWVAVCTRLYEQVVAGGGGASLRPYAGVNAGEFFAVATESFFDAPLTLRAEHPDLYGVLAGYYRQDPAARLARGGGG
jgi:Mlc titration factor MtfA (ptsG expression regulator)